MLIRSLGMSLLLLGLIAAPALARDAFAGTWQVVVTPDEESRGGKGSKDTLTFKGSQFTSAACKVKGIEAMTYEEDTRAGIVATFKAEGKSKKGEGSVVWTGTASGGQIKGELVWTKEDGKAMKHAFTGERK